MRASCRVGLAIEYKQAWSGYCVGSDRDKEAQWTMSMQSPAVLAERLPELFLRDLKGLEEEFVVRDGWFVIRGTPARSRDAARSCQ